MSDFNVSGLISMLLWGGPTEGSLACSNRYKERDEAKRKQRELQAKNPDPAPAPKPEQSPVIVSPPAKPPTAQAVPTDVLITGEPALAQEMDGHVSGEWQMAHWSNGNPFNVTWQSDNVTFNNGIMILQLDNDGCPQTCDNKPYASGEYRSAEEIYSYGLYETRMKAAAGNGLVSSFFTYAGTYGKQDHHEIDFEILGKNCNVVQTNYYAEGKGHHEEMIDLGFNACEDFHNYGFKWTEQSLSWFIDGKEVRKVTASGSKKVPNKPGKIMVNFWAGIGVNAWLKPFKYPGKPLQAQYDWIRYSPKSD